MTRLHVERENVKSGACVGARSRVILSMALILPSRPVILPVLVVQTEDGGKMAVHKTVETIMDPSWADKSFHICVYSVAVILRADKVPQELTLWWAEECALNASPAPEEEYRSGLRLIVRVEWTSEGKKAVRVKTLQEQRRTESRYTKCSYYVDSHDTNVIELGRLQKCQRALVVFPMIVTLKASGADLNIQRL